MDTTIMGYMGFRVSGVSSTSKLRASLRLLKRSGVLIEKVVDLLANP